MVENIDFWQKVNEGTLALNPVPEASLGQVAIFASGDMVAFSTADGPSVLERQLVGQLAASMRARTGTGFQVSDAHEGIQREPLARRIIPSKALGRRPDIAIAVVVPTDPSASKQAAEQVPDERAVNRDPLSLSIVMSVAVNLRKGRGSGTEPGRVVAVSDYNASAPTRSGVGIVRRVLNVNQVRLDTWRELYNPVDDTAEKVAWAALRWVASQDKR